MKIKQGKYCFGKLKYLPWLHDVGLTYSFGHEIAREHLPISCFIDSDTFP